MKYIRCLLLLISLLCLSACRLTKYVPEGEYLVSKVSVHSDNKNIKASDAKNYIKQQPNHKTFSFIPLPLTLFNLSGQDTTLWMNRFLRRCGTAPEIYDTLQTSRSERELRKFLINKGYMDADVVVDVESKKDKRVNVNYRIISNTPRVIDSFSYDIANDSIAGYMEPLRKGSLVKEGILLDRNVLEQERVRLSSALRNCGYWEFNKELISYTADTIVNSNDVDLELNISRKDLKRYVVNSVTIITDHDPMDLSVNKLYDRDTVVCNNISIIYGQKKYLRHSVLAGNCMIQPGEYYSDKSVDATYASFARLKILKYVNVRFEKSKVNDNGVDCFILLTPVKNQTITTELEGTNSAGDFGFAAGVTYQHRNIFNGSETFTAKVRGGYENLTGDIVGGFIKDSYREAGAEMSLSFPKFVFPFIRDDLRRRIKASTDFTATYSYQHRPEYERVIASGGLKYNLLSGRIKQTIDVMDISYIYLPYRSDEFVDNIINNNPITYSSYKDHLITRSAYTIYKTTFNPTQKNKDIYSIRASVEFAGNILYAASKAMRRDTVDGAYTLFNLRYEQYFKFDFDYSYTKVIDDKNSVAFHIATGIGIPYGNSDVLPFEKRYYSGGANSVRGWSVRTLGPGRYSGANGSLDYFNQCGDIRLDLSMEYRSRLFWKLEMAAFVDAGNVWTLHNYDIQAGGQFKFKTFYEEIALSWGLGVRFDFDYFVLRMDMGVKAYDPSKIGREPWVFMSPLKSENQTFHFAVGYPF